nr:MAG TPA: hypothetical protein [Caudoviricetes sp.]
MGLAVRTVRNGSMSSMPTRREAVCSHGMA